MDIIKNRIQLEVDCNRYSEYAKHRDLISFVVCSECFLTENDINFGIEPEFNEIIVIVEKDWLFDIMQKDGISKPRKYLQEEYSSDNAYNWYRKALFERKVVMVDYN